MNKKLLTEVEHEHKKKERKNTYLPKEYFKIIYKK